jgi:metal-responsive CopG/Arc/MetJ family transcriptional regulator
MKIKTSVTISQELLQVMDEFIGSDKNRSLFLEKAAWEYIAKLRRAQRNARDIEIINRRADYLNAEVLDALAYQVAV